MATDATLNEGDTFVFTVNRGGDTSRPASVDFAVTGNGGNPADADDFSGTAVIVAATNFLRGGSSS